MMAFVTRAETSRPTLRWRRPPVEVFGPYDVREEIGRGGRASVHHASERHAERLGLGRPLTLERLRPQFASDWQLVTAFMHEAHLASQLRHPHIARTHAYGRIDGTYYAATELVAGPTLEQIMQQSRTAAGAIPLPVVVELLIQICDALDYIHNQAVRIVHRDVSPANLVLARSGELKLMDFGVAKTASGRAPTHDGVIKGTLGYAAPEYTDGRLDARSDLFSVGVIAHELLVGKTLFSGNYAAARWRVREKPIQPPSRWNPDISRDLDDIVLTALQRDVSLRWQNAAAMRFALRAVARALGGHGARQVVDWTAWAFERAPRDSSKVRRLVDALELDLRAAG